MSGRQDSDVGITAYLNTHVGFQGIIKMRFMDFLVNEIDENGQVVHLTDMTCESVSNDNEKKTSGNDDASALSDEEKEKLADFVKDKEIDEVILKCGNSKEERTRIHKAIRWLYPELESQAVQNENDGEKIIRVTRAMKGQRSQAHRYRMPRRSLCKFALFKTNIGTMEAMNLLAKKVHVHKANGFQYAGTKDKRAVTTQLVTAPVAAERLCGLNKLNLNFKVGNFSYCTKPLQLGALEGNHFSMVVRNVEGASENISTSFESFTANGFLNYFGLQRFGTTNVPTQTVGIALLRSEWQCVVDLILTPRKDERNADLDRGLQEFAKSGDPDAALNCLKYKSSIEGLLLQGIKRFGKTQLLQAITVIPRNTRKMYVHAYQSYVWNRIASRRIDEGGMKPITGDLVFLKTFNEKCEQDSGEPSAKKVCLNEDSGEVRILGEDDVDRFTLEDVVLPLPGHDIQYPGNGMRDWYKTVMQKDGIDIDKHMVHKVKDYSLPGTYRNLVVRASRVEYDLVRYDDFKIPLLLTDLDRLNSVENPMGVAGGKFLAVRLQFSLPSSSYATVALRELMKIDISLSAQMKLNGEHGAGPISLQEDT